MTGLISSLKLVYIPSIASMHTTFHGLVRDREHWGFFNFICLEKLEIYNTLIYKIMSGSSNKLKQIYITFISCMHATFDGLVREIENFVVFFNFIGLQK